MPESSENSHPIETPTPSVNLIPSFFHSFLDFVHLPFPFRLFEKNIGS